MIARSRSDKLGLAYSDAVDIVGPKLHGLDLVLVGGQALNYWVERYRRAVPELDAAWPFTSEDVDFHGTRQDAQALAARLNVEPELPGIDEVTPNSGVIFVPHGQTKLRIDVLRMVQGVDSRQLRKTALLATDNQSDTELRIMHPVLCMFSRAHNVIDLPVQYDTQQGIKQLRGSILCAREFIRERASAHERRQALDLVELVFRFSLERTSLRLWTEKRIDTFEAVEIRSEYGSKFAQVRYPQMVAQVRAART